MDVLMPQLGETVAEGTIVKWYKAKGDPVAAGDTLFEIETDKTSMEVTALGDGTLAQILVAEGATVPVGAVCAIVASAGEDSSAMTSADLATPAAPAGDPVASATTSLDPYRAVRTPERNYGKGRLPSGVQVSPLARRLASEGDIDLQLVRGSGPRGRIVAADIRAINNQATSSADAAPVVPTGADKPASILTLYVDRPHSEMPIDGMRATIARRLVEAKATIPHFYLTAEVEMEPLLALRARLKQGGAQVSLNDIIVRAYALALQRTPEANAIWAGDRILQFERSDVGIAVAVEGGLFTPVIRDADRKSLTAIATEIRDLAERARDRKLRPADYQGGSASVSNLGMYGVREFAAVINPPQSTILAVGAAERRPVETADGGMRFASRMTVTLSADHRVVDGAVAARLLAAFRALVEQPLSILA